MSTSHGLILIAALAAGIPRMASAQLADPIIPAISPPAVPSVKRDLSAASRALKRDEQVEHDLNRVIDKDSDKLSSDEHQLHQVRSAIVRDSTKNRTAMLAADQVEGAQLEQSVTVLKGCLAAEHELALEDRRDIRLDRQEIRLDGRG